MIAKVLDEKSAEVLEGQAAEEVFICYIASVAEAVKQLRYTNAVALTDLQATRCD